MYHSCWYKPNQEEVEELLVSVTTNQSGSLKTHISRNVIKKKKSSYAVQQWAVAQVAPIRGREGEMC